MKINDIYLSNSQVESYKITEREKAPGIRLIDVYIKFTGEIIPNHIALQWFDTLHDMFSVVNENDAYQRGLKPDWRMSSTDSRLAYNAPVHQIVSPTGQNRLTLALSDAYNPARISTGVEEKGAKNYCEVALFEFPTYKMSEYSVTIYEDTTDRRYEDVLRDVEKYWEVDCGFSAPHIPDTAKRPLYSTWYSFHQDLNADRVVEQCRLAKEMGMESVIVDDGWQCDDREGGYEYCGDWKPSAVKVSDMKTFVDRVHETGMKFSLWFSLPFIGNRTEAFEKYRDMLIYPDTKGFSPIDPRFPEARHFVAEKITSAVRDWGLDGVKLDFIDTMKYNPKLPDFDPRWDTTSIEAGIDRLLDEVVNRAREINPELLIEFRQSYTGPIIRKYGNMIRVSDCPADSLSNRIDGVNLRLLCGNCAVHSDMLMWNNNEKLETAALQVICTLFLVPQISVMLDEIPEEQQKMLRFYLKFWNDHRDTLLSEKFYADNPESLVSQIRAERSGEIVAVAYANPVLRVGTGLDRVYFINASGGEELYVRFESDGQPRGYNYRCFDCMGNVTSEGRIESASGIVELPVKNSGMAEIY